ncbi:MAG: hypothetical protein ACRCTZ_08765 [Sarcina sp.]
MNVSSNEKERFSNFWVFMFSLMVGYLIYFFVGTKITSEIVENKEVAGFIGVFFMTTCMSIIYMILNFMLERRMPRFFRYVLWGHYYALFIIVFFCLNIGQSEFVINPFVDLNYTGAQYGVLIFRCVILFIPIGYLVRKEVFIKSCSFMLLFILTMELSQYVFRLGTFNISEIGFSMLGVCIGYFLFQKRKSKKKRKRT